MDHFKCELVIFGNATATTSRGRWFGLDGHATTGG